MAELHALPQHALKRDAPGRWSHPGASVYASGKEYFHFRVFTDGCLKMSEESGRVLLHAELRKRPV